MTALALLHSLPPDAPAVGVDQGLIERCRAGDPGAFRRFVELHQVLVHAFLSRLVGPGVLAVLERYAHIAWGPAGVTQDSGDVFYRLAPDKSLLVRTPVGDIGSAGACSRVRVEPTATTTPVVFVAVAQGQVDVHQAGHDVRLGAGRYALLDARSVRTDEDDDPGEIAFAFAHERARRYAVRLDPTLEPDPPSAPPSALPRPPALAAPPVASPVASPSAPAASSSPRVFIRPPCTCSPLTVPRLHFVPELLRSVEVL